MLDAATSQSRYYVDYIPEDDRIDAQTYADLPLVARLLDDCDIRLTRRAIIDALVKADGYAPDWQPDYGPAGPFVLRTLNVTRYLDKAGDIRAIHLDPARRGWVWNHIDRSDEAWRARAMAAPIPSMHLPLPVTRLRAPEAYVVAIGPGETREDVDDT